MWFYRKTLFNFWSIAPHPLFDFGLWLVPVQLLSLRLYQLCIISISWSVHCSELYTSATVLYWIFCLQRLAMPVVLQNRTLLPSLSSNVIEQLNAPTFAKFLPNEDAYVSSQDLFAAHVVGVCFFFQLTLFFKSHLHIFHNN
jgi:hypothetical protein